MSTGRTLPVKPKLQRISGGFLRCLEVTVLGSIIALCFAVGVLMITLGSWQDILPGLLLISVTFVAGFPLVRALWRGGK